MSLSTPLFKTMVAGFFLVFVRMADGAIVTWDGGGGNSLWSTAANWDTDTVPLATDEVHIIMAGAYTVTLNVDTTVAGLTLGSPSGTQTLFIDNRMLTINGNILVESGGKLQVENSTIDGSGTLTNNGLMILTDAAILNMPVTNNGTLNVPPSVPGSDAAINDTLVNNGSVTVTAGSAGPPCRLDVDGDLDNNGLITVTSLSTFGHTSALQVTNGMLNNDSTGTIRSGSGGTGLRNVTAQIVNQGEIQANLADLTITNSGSVFDSTNGTINCTETLTIKDGETLFGSNTQ
ncbi:MAG: hypothetical protein ACYTHJ_20630, partial [Planctomycetota bacterium]